MSIVKHLVLLNWFMEITDADSVEIPAGVLSSTQFECVSVKAFIEERQRLIDGDITLNWILQGRRQLD